MRNKTSLALMELLIMVLVFALAAAVCLRMFALSDRLSREQEAKAHAALLAQNTAEWLKDRGEGFSEAPEGFGWQMEDGAWIQRYDKNWKQIGESSLKTEDSSYELKISEEKTEIIGLVRVRITVSDGTKDLFAIPVAWQEVIVRE